MTREYIGARYVPKFEGVFDSSKGYEPLSIVVDSAGNSYTSKKTVPVGSTLADTSYWVLTGVFSAQVEALENKISSMVQYFNTVADMIDSASNLKNGDVVLTSGYYADNDGGGGTYIIAESNNGIGITVGTKYALPIADEYYNVKWLGAKSDQTGDNFNVIQNIITAIHNGTVENKPIFIPKGQYNISKNIIVADNISILGEGKDSYIYLTTSGNASGQVILCCGSNIMIKGLSGGYLGGSSALITFNAQMGFIGISNYVYEYALSDNYMYKESHNNILCEDIYTDCQYCLQTETSENSEYVITDVVYKNVHAPRGLVSVVAQTAGTIKNVVLDTIECQVLRIGNGLLIENILVKNFNIENVINRSRGTVFENGVVKMNTSSPAFVSGIWRNYGEATFHTGLRCDMNNVYVDANNLTTRAINCDFIDADNIPMMLNNVVAKNGISYDTRGGAFINAVNCKFGNSSLSFDHARLVNCQIDNATYLPNANYSERIEDITLASGVNPTSTSIPVYVYKTGNMCKLSASVNSTSFARNSTIMTLPVGARPFMNTFGTAILMNGTNGIGTVTVIAIPISILSTGEVQIPGASTTDADITAGRCLKIDTVYFTI